MASRTEGSPPPGRWVIREIPSPSPKCNYVVYVVPTLEGCPLGFGFAGPVYPKACVHL